MATTELGAEDYVSPYGMPYTEADLKRMRDQARKEAAIQAGAGLLGTAVQGYGLFHDTAQDTYNASELARLEELAKRNKLGLSEDERTLAQRTLMNPVRQLATEERGRTEDLLASTGATQSAAALSRAQRDTQKTVAAAAGQAGTEILRQDIAAKQRQIQEMEERRAYASERDKEKWQFVSQAIGQLAPQVGSFFAAEATQRAPLDADLMAMKTARYKDGTPVYPGLRDLTLEDMQKAYKAGTLYSLASAPGQAMDRVSSGNITGSSA